MATNINNKLVCNEPHANLDSYYGPYSSVHEAFVALADTTVNGVNYTKKYIGLTVGVWNSSQTEITEYWFKGGLAESNLVLKTSESGLPGGVKIVTFDKNGATGGVQNSIITDNESKVILPECTLTKTGVTFSKWSYNGTQKNPGDVITIGASTVVQAIWGAVQNYTVSWTNGSNIAITGTAGGTPISSGASVAQGTTIVLTATAASGYQFKSWTDKPSGATEDENTLTFTLNGNVSGVSAVAEAVIQYYTVSWTDSGNTSISGKYNTDKDIISGVTQIPAGSTVVLTGTPHERDYKVKTWTNAPGGATEGNNTLTFVLNSNVTGISATSEQTYVLTWSGDNTTINGMIRNGSAISSGERLFSGTPIILTAKPSEGYIFRKWDGLPAEAVATNNPVEFKMGSSNMAVIAVVEAKVQEYSVSWEKNVDNGTVTGTANGNNIEPGARVASGSKIVLTANLASGYGVKTWTNAPDDAIKDGNRLTFTLTGNVSDITANTGEYYTVSWTNGDHVNITGKANGDGISSPYTKAFSGDTIELTATPATGYQFENWTNAPQGASSIFENPLSFEIANNSISDIRAEVKKIRYTINFEGTELFNIICKVGGQTYTNESVTLDYGAAFNLTAQAKQELTTFDSWDINNLTLGMSHVVDGNPVDLTMDGNNAGNLTITAREKRIKPVGEI